jgi:hypothetical protein
LFPPKVVVARRKFIYLGSRQKNKFFMKSLLSIFFLLAVCSLSAQETDAYQKLKSNSQQWQGVNLDSALLYAGSMLEMAETLQDHQKIRESLLPR